ncbi:hypothetical protein ACIQ34_09755 [Ureibacillus sp. NPDC094379]
MYFKKEPKQMAPQELLETFTRLSQLPSRIRTKEEKIYLTVIREEIIKRMK